MSRRWTLAHFATSSGPVLPSGSDSREARIHTSDAVVSAPTLDLALARCCLTVAFPPLRP